MLTNYKLENRIKSKTRCVELIKKNIPWSLRVTPELDEKVERVASIMGIGKMEVVRFAVANMVGTMLESMGMVENQIKSGMNANEELIKKQVKKLNPEE